MVVIGLIVYHVKITFKLIKKQKVITLHISSTANIRDNFVNYKTSFVMCNMRFQNVFANTFFTSFSYLILYERKTKNK